MVETTQQGKDGHAALPVPPGAGSAPLVPSVTIGEPTTASISPPPSAQINIDKVLELRWKFAEETHQYVREYIRQADQKAAFFFAGATALTAFLYKAGLVRMWAKPPTQWVLIDTISFLATIGLAISAFACLVTIFPRLRGSKRGYVYFGAIGEFESRKEYANGVLGTEIQGLIEAKLCHVHDLATVCGKKYSVLKTGQLFGALGVAATVVLLLLAP